MVRIQEVDMVRKPADAKDGDDHDEHLDDLPLVLPALDGAVRELSRGVAPQILAYSEDSMKELISGKAA